MAIIGNFMVWQGSSSEDVDVTQIHICVSEFDSSTTRSYLGEYPRSVFKMYMGRKKKKKRGQKYQSCNKRNLRGELCCQILYYPILTSGIIGSNCAMVESR